MARYSWLRQIQGETATRLDTSRRGAVVLELSCRAPLPRKSKQDYDSELWKGFQNPDIRRSSYGTVTAHSFIRNSCARSADRSTIKRSFLSSILAAGFFIHASVLFLVESADFWHVQFLKVSTKLLRNLTAPFETKVPNPRCRSTGAYLRQGQKERLRAGSIFVL